MYILILVANLLGVSTPQLTGVATVYAGEQWEGNLLYCDHALPGTLRYEKQTDVWFAFDIEEYRSGRIACGDIMRLDFADGTHLLGRALDAGTFQGYWVTTYGPETPIVVDIPGLWWPYSDRSSQLVSVTNLSQPASGY